jgi:hypothetical protein
MNGPVRQDLRFNEQAGVDFPSTMYAPHSSRQPPRFMTMIRTKKNGHALIFHFKNS